VVVDVEVGEGAVVVVVVEEEEEVELELELELVVTEDSREPHRVQDREVEVLEAAGLSVNLLEEGHLHPPPRGHHLSLLSLSPCKCPHRLHRLRLLVNLLNVSMTLSYVPRLVCHVTDFCRTFLLVLGMGHWVRKSNFSQTITGYPISPTRKFINTLLLFLQGTVTLLPGAWQTPFGKVQKSKPR